MVKLMYYFPYFKIDFKIILPYLCNYQGSARYSLGLVVFDIEILLKGNL